MGMALYGWDRDESGEYESDDESREEIFDGDEPPEEEISLGLFLWFLGSNLFLEIKLERNFIGDLYLWS